MPTTNTDRAERLATQQQRLALSDEVDARFNRLAQTENFLASQIVGRLVERCPEIINAVLDDIEAQR